MKKQRVHFTLEEAEGVLGWGGVEAHREKRGGKRVDLDPVARPGVGPPPQHAVMSAVWGFQHRHRRCAGHGNMYGVRHRTGRQYHHVRGTAGPCRTTASCACSCKSVPVLVSVSGRTYLCLCICAENCLYLYYICIFACVCGFAFLWVCLCMCPYLRACVCPCPYLPVCPCLPVCACMRGCACTVFMNEYACCLCADKCERVPIPRCYLSGSMCIRAAAHKPPPIFSSSTSCRQSLLATRQSIRQADSRVVGLGTGMVAGVAICVAACRSPLPTSALLWSALLMPKGAALIPWRHQGFMALVATPGPSPLPMVSPARVRPA